MAKSLFSGLFEHFGKYTPNNPITRYNSETMFLGQVLGVLTGEELEEAIENGEIEESSAPSAHKLVGTVIFKVAGLDDKKYEEQVTRFAYPLDKGTFRLPIPGELVLAIMGYTSGETGERSVGYFYTRVVTGELPVRDAVQPNAITKPSKVEVPQGPFSTLLANDAIGDRFDKRLNHNTHTVKKEGKVFPTMREGDKILEGRFGGSIRFTSTITKKDVWSTQDGADALTKGSNDGDPFIVIKSTKLEDQSTAADQNTPKLVDDNVNADDSSIYLNTSQYFPLNVASSKTMYTWGYEIERLDMPLTLEDPSSRLQAYFPDKYDPNFKISVDADFPFQPNTFDDNPIYKGSPGQLAEGGPLTFGTISGLQPVPAGPAPTPQRRQYVVDALNATFAKGEQQHMCAQGTYNHAYNFTALLRGQPTKPAQVAGKFTLSAGGHANRIGFFNNLVKLGYTRCDQGSNFTSAQLSQILKSGPGVPWGLGDAVSYWANDGNPKDAWLQYGHAQFYTGPIPGKVGNWSCDNKPNWGGSYFVYASRKSDSWNLIVFRAPQA